MLHQDIRESFEFVMKLAIKSILVAANKNIFKTVYIATKKAAELATITL